MSIVSDLENLLAERDAEIQHLNDDLAKVLGWKDNKNLEIKRLQGENTALRTCLDALTGSVETELQANSGFTAILQVCMQAVQCCDEKPDDQGLCACARYIGHWLRTFDRNFRAAGRLLDTECTGAALLKATLVQISGILSEEWGDSEDEIDPAIQALFDALKALDMVYPGWNEPQGKPNSQAWERVIPAGERLLKASILYVDRVEYPNDFDTVHPDLRGASIFNCATNLREAMESWRQSVSVETLQPLEKPEGESHV